MRITPLSLYTSIFSKLFAALFFVILPLAALPLVGCSSPPKNPGETFDIRKQAENQLDTGNKTADRGDYESALILITEAVRLATVSDNPSLLVRTGLSRGNVLFALGRGGEASACWEAALGEAEKSGNGELAAVSRIHIARGKLLSGEGASQAASIRDQVSREMEAVKSDKLYIAFSWIVVGLAEKESERYREAETAVKRSLDIYEKDRYFEQAAYSWFLIASVRSLSGSYGSALQALESAIEMDRKVENSWGLATDWRAMGDVQKKAGNAAEARAAYLRAAAIFRSLGNDAEAAKTEERLVN